MLGSRRPPNSFAVRGRIRAKDLFELRAVPIDLDPVTTSWIRFFDVPLGIINGRMTATTANAFMADSNGNPRRGAERDDVGEDDAR